MPNGTLLVNWRKRWNRSLLQFIGRRVRTSVDVEDLAQETYLRLLRARDLADVRNPQAYLLRVASHVVSEWCHHQPPAEAFEPVHECDLEWYRATFSRFTPSASLNYRWDRHAMTYVSYSEGFKGGGWNSHFNSVLTPAQQAALQEFKPEEAKTVELGAKLDLVGNTVRLNFALFDSDYTDMQITYRGPAPAGVAPFLTNAGKASIKGAEAELTWAPTLDWNIEASLGHLESSIDRLDINPLAVIPPGLRTGNALPFAPRWQGHLGIAYTARAAAWKLTPRVDASYQSRTYFDATNTPQIAQLGGYTVLNASLLVGPDDGPWHVTLGVNNATDKLYAIAGNSSLSTGSGYAEIAYARPREYFGVISYAF
jgi:iron complex outermembrane recepter protein